MYSALFIPMVLRTPGTASLTFTYSSVMYTKFPCSLVTFTLGKCTNINGCSNASQHCVIFVTPSFMDSSDSCLTNLSIGGSTILKSTLSSPKNSLNTSYILRIFSIKYPFSLCSLIISGTLSLETASIFENSKCIQNKKK